MGGVLIRQASQREGPVGALQFKRLRGAESTLPAFLLQGLVFSAVWFALGALVCYVVQQAGGACHAPCGGGRLLFAPFGHLKP